MKTQLQNLYDTVKDIVQTGYTADSWQAFQEARDAAKAVLDNPNVTQDEVSEAYSSLYSAWQNLKAEDQSGSDVQNPDGSQPGQSVQNPDGTQSGQSAQNSDSTKPASGSKTGDTAPIAPLAVAAAAAAAAIVLVFRRKRTMK